MNDQFTTEQLKCAFDEITDKAFSALELCGDAIANPDADRQSAVLVGVEALVQQMGWIADHHGGKVLGDAASWMLPMKYHQAAVPGDNSANDA